jgi:hypothetical protein
LSTGKTTALSSASVVESAPGATAPSASASANAPIEPTPIIVEKADAGTMAGKTPERTIATPQPVPVTRKRGFPAAAVSAAPSVGKDTPPATSPNKPTIVPEKRYDNAAGI